MRRYSWQLALGLALIAASAATYALQIAVFHRTGETLFYLLQDLAFLPLQVLLVTIVLNALLARRERSALLRQLNRVVGVFFTELGTPLLLSLSRFDRGLDVARPFLSVGMDWTDRHFATAREGVRRHESELDCGCGDLVALKEFLREQHGFLMGLLGNPNLLEHDSFTELLWAICHVSEELQCHGDVCALDAGDAMHLAGDIRRAYTLLLAEWLAYAQHLRREYPYMYSLVVRTNPFSREGREERVGQAVAGAR